MATPNPFAHFRYVPHPVATIAHLLMLAAAFALFMGRKPGLMRSETLLSVAPTFYSHVSNLSLSYVLYAGVGFLWLMTGMRLHVLAAAGLVLAATNVIYELLIPVLNTRDPMDAAYGVAGTALAFVTLCAVRRFGLMPVQRRAASQPDA